MIDEKKLICDLYRQRELYEEKYGKVEDDFDDEHKEGYINSFDDMIGVIEQQPKVGEWIPCSERMPEERESSFAKLKGTDKWIEGMFEKKSDDVNVTIEFSDGKRKVITTKLIDGQWKKHTILEPIKFIAWQPLPEHYKGD